MTGAASISDNTHIALLEIAARAASLSERRRDGFTPLPTDSSLIDTRYQAWKAAVGKADPQVLERRLTWDSLTPDTIRPFLGKVTPPPNYTLPAWAEKLAEVIEVGRTTPLTTLLTILPNLQAVESARTTIPFLEFWLPFAQVAVDYLTRFPMAERLDSSARQKLLSWLIHRLQRFGSATLQAAFWKARLRQRPLLALIGPEGLNKQTKQANRQPGREEYLAFIQELLDDPLPFYREYSVIARLLGTILDQWNKSVELFLSRLANDLPALQRLHTNAESDPGEIAHLEMGISDPHHDGQAAIEIEFTHGLHLIYKPHNLQPEVAYQRLVEWLNDHSRAYPDLLPIQTFRILDRGSYGWAEFVRHQPCENSDAVARYYQRLGSLICLLYMLNATDMHYENVIAAGEHPIPVDLEMILYSQIRIDVGEEDTDQNNALQWLGASGVQRTVFGSGLLPTAHNYENAGYDSSGIGDLNMPVSGANVPIWKYINTDDMVLLHEDKAFFGNKRTNMPYLGNAPQSAAAYLPALLRGFRATYRLILEHRERLESDILPMFKGILLRFVFRPTKVYFNVLYSAISPQYVRDGADFSIHLEHLARTYAGALWRPRYWEVLLAEIQALENMDVPHFSMLSDSTALLDHNLLIEDVFQTDGYQQMLNVLRRFSEFDCQQQSNYILAALQPDKYRTNIEIPNLEAPPFSRNEWIDEAVHMAELLVQSSQNLHDTYNWVYLGLRDAVHNHRNESGASIRHVGYGFYTGLTGIAVFFAALWRVTALPVHREWALCTLNFPRALLKGIGRKWLSQQGMGAADGLAAVAYGLTVCGRLLDDPAIISDAADAATLITADMIAADTTLDVISGSGGVLLSLIALYQQTRSDAILDTARLCGEHLLATLKPDPISGLRGWPTLDGKLLGGFSHGVAGIALAMLRLYAATGDSRYQAAAAEAIAYENSLYSPTYQNWRDLRQDDEAYMTSWCHGAPGIALSRMGGLAMLDQGGIRDDLNRGLATTQAALPVIASAVDHLCCGNLGRTDILLEAGLRLGRSDLIGRASQTAANVVSLNRQTGGYSLISTLPRGVLNPGLFNGGAGIGYALLRLAQPDLPCVLLWD